MYSATCIAPVNIAVIKYWGKRDEELILPVNDSLSVTLNTEEMSAKTTVVASPEFNKNQMWLNGKEETFEGNMRLVKCVEQVRKLSFESRKSIVPIEWNLRIVSENNFPTAAGLASSAAGYACLVYSLSCLYGVDDAELSVIARQGSGSACRSMYGGFVQWRKGDEDNGKDSVAVQIAPASHWPEMHVLILVVSDNKKQTSSTNGMQRSVKTSELLKYRYEKCVPQRIDMIIDAINRKNFEKFAEITMKDSNQFHAIAQDTYPPCVYMNDVSHKIVEFVHNYNKFAGCVKVAYTFDAGPNGCLYLLKNDVPAVLSAILKVFPTDCCDYTEYIKGIAVDKNLLEVFKEEHKEFIPFEKRNLLKYVIHSKVGDGPKKLSSSYSLIDSVTGYPKNRTAC